MQSNSELYVIFHESVGILPFSATNKRFDVDLTGKMTELDQTKHTFGTLIKFPTTTFFLEPF